MPPSMDLNLTLMDNLGETEDFPMCIIHSSSTSHLLLPSYQYLPASAPPLPPLILTLAQRPFFLLPPSL